MKRYFFVVLLLVLAVGVAVTFLVLNYSRVNYSTITASVIGEGGEITGPGELHYEDGGSARYIITSYQGYHIKEVKKNDEVILSEKDFRSNYSLVLTNIHGVNTLTVEFAEDLTVSTNNIGVNGSVTYCDSTDLNRVKKPFAYVGQDVEIVISPNIRDVNHSEYFPVSYIVINNRQYSVQELRKGISALGYRLSQSNAHGEMVLTLRNVQNNMVVEAAFGIDVTFAYGTNGAYTTNDVMGGISDLSVDAYENVVNKATNNAPTGKVFKGWSCRLYDTSKDTGVNFGTTFITYDSIVRISNVLGRNVYFTAVYENE